MSSNVFSLPIVAPSITLTGPGGLVTDLILADEVATPLVRPDAPVAGSGVAGADLQVAAAVGASSASVPGGKGGDLELFAGGAGTGVGDANGGSVLLQPGSGSGAGGAAGLVRVFDGPLLTNGPLVSLGAGASVNLGVSQLRDGILYGTPGGGGATYNLPTAEKLLTGLPGLQIGDRLEFSVSNTGTGLVTMNTADVNITDIGTPGSFQITVGEHAARFALVATSVTTGSETFNFIRIG